MYKYLNLRFDARYSKFISVEDIVKILDTVPQVKRVSPIKYIGENEFPWGIINLLQCDSEGNYSVKDEDVFKEINLIEFIFSDEDNSFQMYFAIALKIAELVNWEIFDDLEEKVIREKR